MGDTKALQAARKPETAQAMGSRSSRAPAPSAMHRLQRSLGNQGMLRLLRADGMVRRAATSSAPEGAGSGEPAAAAEGLLARGLLRAKLEVGAAETLSSARRRLPPSR